MISFVTWIFDRCHQYAQVLPVNLDRAPNDCEFILLDIGSTDPLQEYVSGVHDLRLRVIIEPWAPERRHFARLYNRAASFAIGDTLVFLDADNAIGPEYSAEVQANVTPNQFVWAFSGDWSDGTCGRIAMHRQTFANLGGFDESLGPIGYQDVDLIDRAKAAGYSMRYFQRPSVVGYAVRNSKQETLACLDTGENYHRHNSRNAAQSRANIAAGRLVANHAAPLEFTL